MTQKRRKFTRPYGERRYKKRFIIAAEGVKTEPLYFALFDDCDAAIQVKCLKGARASAPPNVLKRMDNYLRSEGLRKSDEAWLVVDKDQWTDTQLRELHEWSKKRDNYGFALSNPTFEFWLLLHFEKGTGIASSSDCARRLKRFLPDYDKDIKASVFTTKRINDAVNRAKTKDNPPAEDWPRTSGSTVYKLVENILKTQAS